MKRNTPLDLVCGCRTTCADDEGAYTVLEIRPGSRCHHVGYVIDAKEASFIRYVNAEWDRAERDYLEQP